MRIGISVISRSGQSIWENGLGQNVFFLAELFQRLPFVESVLLIDVGDQNAMPPQIDLAARNLRLTRVREATDEVDVVIEMGGALDIEWLDLIRARGKKVVFHCCGQPYVNLVEPAIFSKPSYSPRPERCDEIWYLPKDAAYAPMMRLLNRCDLHEVPFIWHPQFIRQRVREVEELGLRYGFDARDATGNAGDVLAASARRGLRVAIFEPNISVVKASTISMLVCDEAYRADAGAVEAMHVLNTLHMKDHPTMLYLANSLDLVRQHKATFHGRHDIVGFMVQHADAIVSHQWQNEQNYSYLDALYGDYPLIHNSPWLREAGYYYHGFDARDGAAQLQRAAVAHASGIDDYRARSQRVFAEVDPFNQHNLDAYAARLLHLCRNTKFANSASRP
ncbi:hypothetical protein HDG34_002708 [Paraburkholderia sp. HC6.4b]|uniref:DUF2827 domain-containing protein n=1 Tax=unclassified Paraburkholderia TaxID=2615204 RepID=UPI0016084EF7|nr:MULTISPECIES: DUF2827 domain-containing protein [unclassified Paraburkholderia]MBB5408771.1 hypothetical protein [Paraburkholderia sp. HC6.4b]MBB5455396.1 hypothetical protein [Paraburkholderia sp. Kb1A]